MSSDRSLLLRRLVEEGLPILPCQAGEKAPLGRLVPHGLYDASADWHTVSRWLAAAPGANWGVRTGPVEAGPWAGRCLAVLDVDDPAIGEAVLASTRLADLTTYTRTPRGGLHVWALSRRPVHTGRVLADNGRPIGDIKAAAADGGPGGYVLVAGQVDGRSYALSWGPGPLLVDDAAAWFRSLLQAAGVAATIGQVAAGADGRAYAAVLRGERVPQGRRHEAIISLAGLLAAKGAPRDIAIALLRAVRQQLLAPGDHPVTDEEVLGVVDYVYQRTSGGVVGSGNGHAPSLPALSLEQELERIPTDYRHGRIVAEALRGRACFVPAWGWMVWTGQRWEPDHEGDRVAAMAAEALRDHYIEQARSVSEPKEQASWLATAAKVLSRAKVSPALAFARAWLQARPEEFDQEPYLLNTSSGIVNLATGKLFPHDPNLRLTRMTTAPYDPQADCPRFRQFLGEIFAGNERLIRYVQRLFGYSVLGDNRERLFIVLWGPGANGKTVLCEAISYVLGDYAQETPPETFMALSGDDVRPRNDLARLHAARLVTASEARDSSRLDAAVIKRITGRDKVPARFLFKEYFEFVPQFLPVLRTNFKPRLSGDDQAAWDRVRLVPFTVRIPPERQDRQLIEKLKAEAPGILRWLVEGCLAYLREGLQDPPEVLEATARYRAEVDDIWRFLEERTIAERGAQVSAKELYEGYKAWCAGQDVEPASQRRLGQALVNLGYEKVRVSGRWYYLGLRLRNDEPSLPPDRSPGGGDDGDLGDDFPETLGLALMPGGKFPRKGHQGHQGHLHRPAPAAAGPGAVPSTGPPHPPSRCPGCRPAGLADYLLCQRGQEVVLLRLDLSRERHVLRSRQAVCFHSGLLRAIEPDHLVVSFQDGSWGHVDLATARKLGREGEFGAERQLAVPLTAFAWQAIQLGGEPP